MPKPTKLMPAMPKIALAMLSEVLNHNGADGVGQDVLEDDTAVLGAAGLGRLDKLLALDGQDGRAHDSGELRDSGDAHGDEDVANALAQGRYNGDGHEDAGDGEGIRP